MVIKADQLKLDALIEYISSTVKLIPTLTDSVQLNTISKLLTDSRRDSSSLADGLSKNRNALTTLQPPFNALTKEAGGLFEAAEASKTAVKKLLQKEEYADFVTKNFSPEINRSTFLAYNTEKLNDAVTNVQQNAIKYEQYIINSEQTGLPPLSFKMPSQSDMIDALAIYLAKRVKQETVLWFFETLRKNASVNEFVREGFPETVKLLESGAIYETPNMGSAWRYALSKDFISFPQHAFESRWLLKYIPPGNQAILHDLQTGVTLARLLQQQYSYYDIIRYMYMEMASLPPDRPTMSKHIIDLLYGLQHELIIQADSIGRPITFEDLDRMDNSTFLVMMELINLRYNKCVAGLTGWKSGEKQLSSRDVQQLKTWVGKLQFTVTQIGHARKQLNNAINAINKQTTPDNFTFTYYSVWKFFSELMKNALPDNSLTGTHVSQFRTSLQYLSQAQEVFELLEKKNYSGAIGTTFNILDALLENNDGRLLNNKLLIDVYTGVKKSLPKELREAHEAFLPEYRKYVDAMLAQHSLLPLMNAIGKRHDSLGLHFLDDKAVLLDSNKVLGISEALKFKDAAALKKYILNKLLPAIDTAVRNTAAIQSFTQALFQEHQQEYFDTRQITLRIAGFLNDVSLAGDSKQLARVVESYAMPPGSYKRKRSVWYSIDLNAFVGAYAGWEIPVQTFNQSAVGIDPGWVYGISAPIGITWSRTKGKKINGQTLSKTGNVKSNTRGRYVPSGHTFSLTLSVVDLGAVVSYRFSHTETVRPQEFKWDQLVSPGLHAGWALPGTPLVIKGGTVFTPQLRKVDEVKNEQNETVATSRQFNIFRFYGGIFFDIPLFNLWERRTITRRYSL